VNEPAVTDNGPAAFFRTLKNHLDACDIDFMVTGSFVSSYYGDPRTTRDLDLIINAPEPPGESIRRFVDRCEGSGYYVSRGATLEPSDGSRRQFNVISATSGWKADIMWLHDRPFSRMEFERRVPIEILGDMVSIPTPEDIVLAKLEWGGSTESRQFLDAVSVLTTIGPSIDHDYLDQWARSLGIAELLNEALAVANQ
jgi:hypothetical protein